MVRSFRLLTALLAFCAVAVGCNSQSSSGIEAVEPSQVFDRPGDFSGSHILIGFQSAPRANPEILRTKEEAYDRAMGIIAQINDGDVTFADAARQNSDGPSGPDGGALGVWTKGQMVPAFDAAIETLEIGQITQEPIETEFGYHIILRESLEAEHFGVEGFIIPVTGDSLQGGTLDQVSALADSLLTACTGDAYEACAEAHGEPGVGVVQLGLFNSFDSGRVPPEVFEAVSAMKIGDIGGPFPVGSGMALIRRMALEQRSGSHILIAYAGAYNAEESVTRTQEEAAERALALAAELAADPSKFDASLAESDLPEDTPNRGKIGTWFTGQIFPELDQTVGGLEIGAVSDTPVETEFGYHIVRRDDPRADS
jgi:parvulin-like peptidyl-prolyl isomerase